LFSLVGRPRHDLVRPSCWSLSHARRDLVRPSCWSLSHAVPISSDPAQLTVASFAVDLAWPYIVRLVDHSRCRTRLSLMPIVRYLSLADWPLLPAVNSASQLTCCCGAAIPRHSCRCIVTLPGVVAPSSFGPNRHRGCLGLWSRVFLSRAHLVQCLSNTMVVLSRGVVIYPTIVIVPHALLV
jgi:hypothetical protein